MVKRALVNIAYGASAIAELALTRKNHQLYAKNCGAEYIELVKDVQLAYGPAAKFKIVEIAKDFDQTLMIDTDTVVFQPNINIFDTCPVGWWGFVDELRYIQFPLEEFEQTLRHIADILLQPHVVPKINVNSGVLLLPRDASIYLPAEKPLPTTWCIEQIWLSYRLLSTNANYVRLDPRFNWCKFFREFESGRKDAIILHWNDRTDRINMLQKLMLELPKKLGGLK